MNKTQYLMSDINNEEVYNIIRYQEPLMPGENLEDLTDDNINLIITDPMTSGYTSENLRQFYYDTYINRIYFWILENVKKSDENNQYNVKTIKLLDCGCNLGIFKQSLALLNLLKENGYNFNIEYTGIEFNTNHTKLAKRIDKDINILESTVEEFISESKFDIILFINFFENDVLKGMAEEQIKYFQDVNQITTMDDYVIKIFEDYSINKLEVNGLLLMNFDSWSLYNSTDTNYVLTPNVVTNLYDFSKSNNLSFKLEDPFVKLDINIQNALLTITKERDNEPNTA